MTLISRRLLEVRPQEIGKIKLGGRGRKAGTSGGNQMYVPEKYDHFEVVTRTRKGGEGAFQRDEAVHEQIGNSPRELEGFLMFPEVDQNLHTVMAHYAGKKPSITCDGEEQTDMKTGKKGPCSRIGGGTCPCRPYGRLQLQLRASPYTGGYYVFRTRSWESINNIQTALEEIHARFGTLFQAPVKLMCYESEDSYTQDGKDRTGRSFKVALVLNVDYDTAAQLMVGAKQRLEATRSRLLLTAGEVKADLDAMDEEEAEEIVDEFGPPRGMEASIGTQKRLDEVVEGLEPVEPAQEPQEPQGPTSEEVGEAEDPPEQQAGPEPQGGLFDPPSQDPPAPGRYGEAKDPADMDPIELKNTLRLYRDSAREMELLDLEAEAYIESALNQSSGRKNPEKALRRLYEIVHEGLRNQT